MAGPANRYFPACSTERCSAARPSRTIRSTTIAVFHLREDRLIAVETVNSAADHMIARRLLEKGVTPTKEQMLSGAPELKPLIA